MTFIVITVVLGLIIGFVSRSSPTVKINNQNSKSKEVFSKQENYESIPSEIKSLIEQNKAFELAEILILIEKDGHTQNLNSLKKAIEFKSKELSQKVEKIKSELRPRNFTNL